MGKAVSCILGFVIALTFGVATVTAQQCPGDCDDSHAVTVNELLVIVNIALGNANVSTCAAGDLNHDGEITIDEILIAVNSALSACPTVSVPTPTLTPAATLTPTPTITATSGPTWTAIPTGGQTVLVGAAKRDISPNLENTGHVHGGNVYLGGFGVGPGRLSKGVLAPIHVRAWVISNGTDTLAFAENDTQGAFASYKKGPWGHHDIAIAVEQATNGRIVRDHVVVGSCHSHSGPDTSGVWGGLPNAYMAFLKDQTVGAITDALAALHPAQLLTGTIDATELINSQFDPPMDQVDGELRVLVAADPTDATHRQTVLINYAAHATVMGADNLLVSSDWPGVVAGRVEQALGIDTAVVMVADVGRTQPNRGGGSNVEKLDAYSGQVTDKVLAALDHLTPQSGTNIGAAQLFLRDTYKNTFLDLALLGALISRNNQAPWLDNNIIGTVVSTFQVGDLFFAAVPGESYPAVQFTLAERVPAARHFVFGLANDQLGYLIAPEEGYPQIAAAAPGNDNALFNVSPAIGDHVMCTLFKAARRIGYTLPTDPDKCATWVQEDNTVPN
jgi:hypothetical protein